MVPRSLRARVAAVLAVFALLVPGTAAAHVIGLSLGEYAMEGRTLRAQIVLRGEDAAAAVPGLDTDGDGKVSAQELHTARDAVLATFFGSLGVLADGQRAGRRPAVRGADG